MAKYKLKERKNRLLAWEEKNIATSRNLFFLEVSLEPKKVSSEVYGVYIRSSYEWRIFNKFLLLRCNPAKPRLGYYKA